MTSTRTVPEHSGADNQTTESPYPLIPVTLLSGALGAGKTTLLRHILAADSHLKLAVIENEFASASIDDQLLGDAAETIVTLADGCICCSIGADLERTLITLLDKRDSGELAFDRLIIECSGMADPGPIAQLFLSEEFVRERYQLEGILTLVDGLHASKQLERPITQAQIGFADKLLVTKSDLISAEQKQALTEQLRYINRRAPILFITQGEVPLDEVFGLQGFELEAEPDQLLFTPASHSGQKKKQFHAPSVTSDSANSLHTSSISSMVLESLYPIDIDTFSIFMNDLLETHGHRLLRYKGVLDIDGAEERLVFQGVFKLYNFDWGRSWGKEKRRSVIVIIGEHLPEANIREAFAQTTERSLLR
ncbi:P-loop guanosine triphosphatase YjiA [Halomonadaceae bacterium LMG 33818]|uniref:GTPase n=1 Tax=Cernens ardua TaxID=3402176 RepID=UPI003EDBAA0D